MKKLVCLSLLLYLSVAITLPNTGTDIDTSLEPDN